MNAWILGAVLVAAVLMIARAVHQRRRQRRRLERHRRRDERARRNGWLTRWQRVAGGRRKRLTYIPDGEVG